MDVDPIDSLLEKLNSGDAGAIELAFLAHQQYLRMIVRRRLSAGLRAKFDSIDVVHSVWLRLFPKFQSGRLQFATVKELQAFLVRATKNHLINKVHHLELEFRFKTDQIVSHPCTAPRETAPDENLIAEELWEQLLASCCPDHREVLRLRRDGVPLDRISAQTGYHPSSVRRILYDLMRRYMNKNPLHALAAQT
jgi:RNA polymerase sigma factor (sigma-70 family)